MHLTATQLNSVGLCIDWHTLLTAKERSGRVKVVYCKAPTICLKRDGYENNGSEAVVGHKAAEGVWTGLQSTIFARRIMSHMYFLCESTSSELRIASIPRKK